MKKNIFLTAHILSGKVALLTMALVGGSLLLAFAHRPLVWVAIGDSITYLNDHPDETGNRVTKGYLTDVTEELPYIHVINQGHNGWTAGNIARSFDELGIPKADVYTVFLGTNDWWQGRPAGTWKDFEGATGDSTIYGSFRVIVDKINHLNKDASVILVTPMPRTDFIYLLDPKNNAYGSYKDKNGQTLEEVANAVIDIAGRLHLELVDLYHLRQLSVPHLVRFKHLKDPQTGLYRNYPYPDYIGLPFHPGEDEYPYPKDAVDMTYDGLHPSDKGNRAIARQLVRILRKL